MMTFSYLTVKWDNFPWPSPCQLLAPSLPARVHSTFTHSVSVLLQGDTSKRVPSEVSQSYLKLLLWYSFRVLSGEMDQSNSTLSFETRALAHVAVPSRQENTAARTEWLLSLEAKTFLQPTDWGSPHSTSAAFLRLFLWFLIDNAGAWASSQTRTPGSVGWSLGRTCSPSKNPHWYSA